MTNANRLNSPNIQFSDQTGTPYANGVLAFFASGTSTPLAVYSDANLTIPRGTSITLDSAGRAGNVFLQEAAYKITLTDVNANLIWTADPVYSSEFDTLAMFNSFNGNPNGSVAGTAGSTGVAASVIWDYTNKVLYVCTTTGNAASAVWTAVNPAASASTTAVPVPGGYLTAASDAINYVAQTDITGATTIYYTAINSQLVPVYNGTSIALQNMGSNQFTYNLTSALTFGNIYDVFAFMSSGVLTMGLGPVWSAGSGSVTPGSCARGTGAGSTQLARVAGLLVNQNSMTAVVSGGTTASVGAQNATYLGSVYINGGGANENGKVTCYRSWGGGIGTPGNANRCFPIWNAYNRQNIYLFGGDSTASWTYNVATTWRQADSGGGANNNYITSFTGLSEETVDVDYRQVITGNASSQQIGIGWNSTTAPSGWFSQQATATSSGLNALAKYSATPSTSFGINSINMLEWVKTNASNTFLGTQPQMTMTVFYRG